MKMKDATLNKPQRLVCDHSVIAARDIYPLTIENLSNYFQEIVAKFCPVSFDKNSRSPNFQNLKKVQNGRW